mmetsp:Transcript_22563/g.67674  ORF Transcript_22563/g.67674 Transcript_22563/m.67674 type:complete len:308 (+) Transcript_22563:1291-2214(+)
MIRRRSCIQAARWCSTMHAAWHPFGRPRSRRRPAHNRPRCHLQPRGRRSSSGGCCQRPVRSAAGPPRSGGRPPPPASPALRRSSLAGLHKEGAARSTSAAAVRPGGDRTAGGRCPLHCAKLHCSSPPPLCSAPLCSRCFARAIRQVGPRKQVFAKLGLCTVYRSEPVSPPRGGERALLMPCGQTCGLPARVGSWTLPSRRKVCASTSSQSSDFLQCVGPSQVSPPRGRARFADAVRSVLLGCLLAVVPACFRSLVAALAAACRAYPGHPARGPLLPEGCLALFSMKQAIAWDGGFTVYRTAAAWRLI